jgi:hypothetical protein
MLVLIYGIPKSASTFAAELARSLAQAEGEQQAILRTRYLGDCNAGGYVNDFELLRELAEVVPRAERLILKTHGPRTPVIDELERSGVLRTIVTYRDPRDAALSAFEAGQKARSMEDESQGFFRLETLDDAIDYIVRHIDRVTRGWLLAAAPLKLQYGCLTRSPLNASLSIARHIGLESVDVEGATSDLVKGQRRVYNFNVGAIGRYADEFSKAQLAKVRNSLSDYLAYCGGDATRLKPYSPPADDERSDSEAPRNVSNTAR